MAGNRKLIAYLAALVVAGLLAIIGHLDATAQVAILGLLGTYTGGNVAAKFGGKNDARKQP